MFEKQTSKKNPRTTIDPNTNVIAKGAGARRSGRLVVDDLAFATQAHKLRVLKAHLLQLPMFKEALADRSVWEDGMERVLSN